MIMTIDCNCPSCGKDFDVKVEGSLYAKYQATPNAMIQTIMPDVHPFIREALISGFCFDCQELTFHSPAPGHEEEWGPMLGECPICGANVYKRDIKDDNLNCMCCGYEGPLEGEDDD